MMSNYFLRNQTNPEWVANILRDELLIDENSPVDLDYVLNELNIRIRYQEIKEGVSGACISKGLNKLIVINPNINNEGRKRFTISHEIGHLLLHHGSRYCLEQNLNLWINSNDKEQEANLFAAGLLLPRAYLVDVLKKKDITVNLIESLALKYNTSLLATAIRLVKLCDDPVALFYHKDNNILWSVKSLECQFQTENSVVSPMSIASNIDKTNNFATGYVDISAWYSDAPDNAKCFEETIYFTNLESSLTIARIEEEW